jgi:diaminohydroxyphosphoribosylaminopyrimidine deaminase / 5-amino-6-(5-phosphoribosylamino)uracil reductase
MSASDEIHMAQALQLARRGLGTTWPNPSVGAIVVAPSGEILARAWTAPGGRPHAEAIALDSSGSRAKGSTLYVTLEPCAHAGGRGPACADLIARARPERAVIALRDPDPRTDGGGIERLIDAGIVVKEGVLAEEACAVTLGHLLRVTEGRPAVTLKLAVGSDGLMPKGNGAPVWITGPDARAHAHLLRARCDAIMVGRGTILADNPSLTCRLPGMACRSPVRVVLDRRLRTPPEAQIFDDLMVPPTKSIPIPMHCRTAVLRSLPSPSMSMACLTSATRSRHLPAAASPASSSKAAPRWRALFSTPTLSMRR